MKRKELLLKRNKISRDIDELKNYRYSKENDMDKVTVLLQKQKFKYDFYNFLLKKEK